MGISSETMIAALTNARRLMSDDMEAQMNEYKKHNRIPEAYDYGSYNIEQPLAPQQSMYQEQMIHNNTGGNASSKLPKAILESMLSHEIDTSSLAPSDDLSVVLNKVKTQMPAQPQIIKEDKVLRNVNASGIDYNMIRDIVNECIDKKLRELNENTLKGVKLKEGKIVLVDNSGNVFHADLEYKGKQKK